MSTPKINKGLAAISNDRPARWNYFTVEKKTTKSEKLMLTKIWKHE